MNYDLDYKSMLVSIINFKKKKVEIHNIFQTICIHRFISYLFLPIVHHPSCENIIPGAIYQTDSVSHEYDAHASWITQDL